MLVASFGIRIARACRTPQACIPPRKQICFHIAKDYHDLVICRRALSELCGWWNICIKFENAFQDAQISIPQQYLTSLSGFAFPFECYTMPKHSES